MTKVEYRKEIWAILKEFRDDGIMSLEELLEKIIAVPFSKKGNLYAGMTTREDETKKG